MLFAYPRKQRRNRRRKMSLCNSRIHVNKARDVMCIPHCAKTCHSSPSFFYRYGINIYRYGINPLHTPLTVAVHSFWVCAMEGKPSPAQPNIYTYIYIYIINVEVWTESIHQTQLAATLHHNQHKSTGSNSYDNNGSTN